MWEAFSERPKLTPETFQALKKYVIRDRERKKQELEQDKVHERLRKERKKREEEKTLTIEQTKEQISQMEKKLDNLKQEKHMLFSQLKKVLHQEVEMRNRAQKEQPQDQPHQQYPMPQGVIIQGSAPPSVQGHAQPFLQGNSHINSVRISKYMNIAMHQQPTQGIKRSSSPTPSSYGPYPGSSYHSSIAGSGPGVPSYASPSPQASGTKQDQPYSSSEYGNKSVKSEQGVYAGAQGHMYPGGQASGAQHVYAQQGHGPPGSGLGGKYVTQQPPPGQAGFGQYSGPPQHFSGHPQSATPGSQGGSGPSGDQYQSGGSYSPRHLPSQRRHQAGGYNTGLPGASGASLPLQQQLEHASQRSGFIYEDAAKRQALMNSQLQAHQLQAASKGSIVSGTVGKPGNPLIVNPPPPKGGGSIVMGNPMRPQQAPPPGPPGGYNPPPGMSHGQQVQRLPSGYGPQSRY